MDDELPQPAVAGHDSLQEHKGSHGGSQGRPATVPEHTALHGRQI